MSHLDIPIYEYQYQYLNIYINFRIIFFKTILSWSSRPTFFSTLFSVITRMKKLLGAMIFIIWLYILLSLVDTSFVMFKRENNEGIK